MSPLYTFGEMGLKWWVFCALIHAKIFSLVQQTFFQVSNPWLHVLCACPIKGQGFLKYFITYFGHFSHCTPWFFCEWLEQVLMQHCLDYFSDPVSLYRHFSLTAFSLFSGPRRRVNGHLRPSWLLGALTLYSPLLSVIHVIRSTCM